MIESSIRFRDIRVVERVFVVCSMLHNFMLSEMDSRESSERVGRGAPLGRDAIWLQDPLPPGPALAGAPTARAAKQLARAWAKRRRELAEHLEYSKRSEKRARIV